MLPIFVLLVTSSQRTTHLLVVCLVGLSNMGSLFVQPLMLSGIRRAEPVVLQLPLDCLPLHVVQTHRTLSHPAIQHREARDEDSSQNDAPSEWLPATS